MSTEKEPITAKPCPFCGSERIAVGVFIRDGAETKCKDCGVSAPAFNPNGVQKALDKWNLRAATPPAA